MLLVVGGVVWEGVLVKASQGRTRFVSRKGRSSSGRGEGLKSSTQTYRTSKRDFENDMYV